MKKTLLLNYFKAATSCNPRKNTTRFNGLLAMFVMVMGMEVSWGQTPNGTLDFGATSNGTAASTSNTGFGGVRVGGGGGGFSIRNPGQSIGSGAELRGIAPSTGSINSVAITSTEYGTAASTFTISFEMHLSGGTSGTWYFFAGNGLNFDAAQANSFTGSQIFNGIRWSFGSSNTITTSNRAAASWETITGTPFAQSTAYYVTIVGNNSSSTVNYGASNTYSVNAYTYDLWVNGSLVGDNLAKAQLPNSTNINGFRFYGENSTSNVAQLALDNVRWYNTCVLPPTHITLVNIPTTGITATNLSSYTAEVRSGSASGPVANSFTGTVTVAKVSGPGGISGTLAANAVAGVATYTNTQFDTSGTYTIFASADSPVVSSDASANIVITSPNNWIGGTGTWNTAGNWSLGAIPSNTDNITISSGSPVLDVDYTLPSGKTLTISGTGGLTINSGKTLTIEGTADFGGKTVILKSDLNGTGAIGQITGTLTGATIVTVERYLPAKRAWRLLTAPLKGSSSNTVAANWQGTANEGLLLFSPATYQSTAMTGYTTGGGSPNIWNYDNGWQKITNISTETLFNTNNSDTKAYLVFATGPHGSSTIANTTTPVATTLKPMGQLITGSVAHSLTANQFKLLPNPYASPLNTAGLVTSNSGTTIWMVDPTLNTFGGYFAYDGTNWTPTTPSASDAYIQSGQGFFVKNAANTTFTIAESHKVSGNSNTWFERTTTDTSVDKIRVLLYKQDNSAWQLADGVLAVNSASGNHEVDAADADKMTNFNENLLFKNGTYNLAIEYRGLPAAGTLQPMQLSGTSAQSYELRIKTENYSNSNLNPYLENTQTGVLTAIPTDGSEVIVPFTGIAATSAAPDSRFRIVYQAPLSADDLNNLVVGVYPNPVHESLFTIELANTNAPARYSLTNLLGQVVQEGSLLSLINAIPVHDLSEGMYLLQINQEGKRFTTKLMIK